MPRLALLCCLVLAVSPASAQDDQIKSLLEKYVKSINAADTKLGAEVWAADATLIHPMGHEKGWEQIKTNFYENVMGKMFTRRELTAKDISIHTLGDAAWVEFNWEFTATLSASNQQMTSKGRETQVLKKTDRGWRVLHVHYSIPFTPPPQ